jgi:crotonobetainyl-CoA:carnitine CoA-transferase CaiB-like acyl-CoA transferase
MPSTTTRPFNDLRVVEIAGSVAGAYAGKLFADFGATVLKIEPPGGDPLRRERPMLDGTGAVFAYTNTGKHSLVGDIAAGPGRELLGRILRGADVVIESSSPGPLTPVSQDFSLPHLVRVYISPFGLDGTYAGFASTPFTDFAISGHMYLTGDPGREPLQGPPHESEYAAGVHGFIAALAGLWARERTGRGQEADISHAEVMASLHQYTTIMWTHGHHIQGRVGNRQPGPWHPNGQLPCKDGFVSINAPGRDRLTRMLAVMGLSHLLDDQLFATEPALLAHRDEFDAAIAPWLLEHTADEVTDLLQSIRVPTAPVRTLHQVLEYDHLRYRDYWRQVPIGGRNYTLPRGPFTISGHPSDLRPPPSLNSASPAILNRFLDASLPAPPPVPANLADGPLTGVRILDLTSGWAGPLAGRILGDLGADVIKIEPPWARGPKTVPAEVAQTIHMYPGNDPGEHPWNRQGMTNKLGRNRRTVCLRMNTPEGKRVVEELVKRVDVVLENFTPRVMPNLGLAFDDLRRINPSIVYVHLPGFGADGPHMHHAALGPMIEAAAGVCAQLGYAGGGPQRQGMAFPDAISGIHGSAGTLLALWDIAADPARAARDVEGPQIEATVCLVGDALLATQATGEEPPFLGNRHPEFAPQGCYPCAGDENWLAISVNGDAPWRQLCDIAALPGAWAEWDVDQRREKHDAIDTAIARWTATQDHLKAMAALQARGIVAAAVLNSREMVEDPHLASRRFFATLEHPESGRFPFPGLPIHFSDTPATYRIASPGLGEFNDAVLREVAGLPADEIAALRAAGVLCDEPADQL